MAMNFGNKLTEGSPKEVLANRNFQEIYLGVETIQLEDRN
jgi:ABC-type branched-subunit amino acid transport system ATPase component